MSTETTAHITTNTPLTPTIEGWHIYLKDQGNSPYTIKAFIGDLNLFSSYLAPDRTVGSITTNDINNFLNWMQNQRGVPCSPKTLARRITSIKSFFRWLNKNGILLIDPAEQVIQQSVLSPLPTVLNPDEVKLALEAAERRRRASKSDTRHYALLQLLLETGIKKSECLALTLNHIDLNTPHSPIIFVRYANPQYRYKERKISISPEWIAAFEEYKSQYELNDAVFPWSPRRLEYLLEDISNDAKLVKHISFDMCRWTCALSDWQSGMDRDKIRQKLGVSKIQWRELRMKLERLSNEMEQISTD